MTDNRQPPIIAALVGFVCTAIALYFEGLVMVGYRTADLTHASTGDMLTLSPHGECVAYADPKTVESRYVGANTRTFHPFGIGSSGGIAVECTLDQARDELGMLVAASVHALRYNWFNVSAAQTAQVEAAYKAAARKALGHASGTLNWTNAVQGLMQLHKPPTNCSEIYPGASLVHSLQKEPIDTVSIECHEVEVRDVPMGAVDELFTHCVQQHQIGRFMATRDSWSWGWYTSGMGGTLDLPVHGMITQPALYPWFAPSGYNDTMLWGPRSRVLTGMRFGWGAFSTMGAIILVTFLMFDSLYSLLVNLTLSQRLNAVADTATAGSGRVLISNTVQVMLNIDATANAMRAERFFMAIFAWVAVLLFRGLYVWAPWNYGNILPRPECTAGSGWAKDTESVGYEWVSTWLQLFVILALPISKSSFFAINYQAAYKDVGATVKVNTIPDSRATRFYFGLIVIGIAACLIPQAWVCIVFGEAWAGSITAPDPSDTWSTNKYADVLFSKTLGALGIALCGGIALPSVLARWLFGGRSFCSCMALIVWALTASVALLPLFLVEGFSLNEEDFNSDCEAFEKGSPQRGACDARFWAYVAGLVLIFSPLLVMLFYCLFRNACTYCARRTRGNASRGSLAITDAADNAAAAQRRSAGGTLEAGFVSGPPFSASGADPMESGSLLQPAAADGGRRPLLGIRLP